jgi:hypothetical protein
VRGVKQHQKKRLIAFRKSIIGNEYITSGAASVSYQTIDDPAQVRCDVFNHTAYARCDYATTVCTLNFDAGETLKTFSIPIIDDSYAEDNETFSIALSNPTGATLGSPATAIVTIIDNDTVNGPNPIFTTPFFVRLHYLDSRDADAGAGVARDSRLGSGVGS